MDEEKNIFSEENNIQKIDDMKTELEQCKKEREEYLDGWKRAKADYINYKKAESERFSSWGALAIESIVTDLLMVLDSFRLGMTFFKEDSSEKKGMILIKNQIEEILRRHGVKFISAEPGNPFDPRYQEAVAEVESEFLEGTIVEEIEGGYMLGEKVIRSVKVKVSKGQKK